MSGPTVTDAMNAHRPMDFTYAYKCAGCEFQTGRTERGRIADVWPQFVAHLLAMVTEVVS